MLWSIKLSLLSLVGLPKFYRTLTLVWLIILQIFPNQDFYSLYTVDNDVPRNFAKLDFQSIKFPKTSNMHTIWIHIWQTPYVNNELIPTTHLSRIRLALFNAINAKWSQVQAFSTQNSR